MQRFVNYWEDLLSHPITSGATEIFISPAKAAALPTISGEDFMQLTLSDITAKIEVVKLLAVNPNTGALTVERGVDGSNADAWVEDTVVSCRCTDSFLTALSHRAISSSATSADLGTHYVHTGANVTIDPDVQGDLHRIYPGPTEGTTSITFVKPTVTGNYRRIFIGIDVYSTLGATTLSTTDLDGWKTSTGTYYTRGLQLNFGAIIIETFDGGTTWIGQSAHSTGTLA